MQGQARLAAERTEQGATPFGRSHTLDVLRGLAIVGVMAIHASQSFPSNIHAVDFDFMCGWTGVNVFYFVSAMTMCLMWTQRTETDPTRKFYIRRFLRIAPLFWLAIPLYLLVNGTGPSYNAPNGIGPHQVILTATFLHGFWPDSVNSVVPGDWSIAAEMTFYLVFPFVITAFGSRRHLYLALAIALHLVNVCLFKPWAFALFSAYYGPGHEAFVWNALHISFLNQLPVFLTGCALFFSLRDGFAKSDAAIFAAFIALSFIADRATGSHEFNYLMINLVLGALVAGCRLHPPRDPLPADRGARPQLLFDVPVALRGDLRPAPDLAACGRTGLAADRLCRHRRAQLSRRTRDLASGRAARAGFCASPDVRGIGPLDDPANHCGHCGRSALTRDLSS
ncbi:acyltransferase [Bradyrhizobium barranii subsp. apii]|uniref:acyltransferase family protein n=1 Tax=Bradyrhizobium barranii TaxID=2992140 RepID=UPI001CD736AF|nr:acyltransferase [Bradyrhizobium barranii]UPT95249.1 acyltransferase [Bradyrhizobium barranii subsp. apii]